MMLLMAIAVAGPVHLAEETMDICSISVFSDFSFQSVLRDLLLADARHRQRCHMQTHVGSRKHTA